MEETEGVMTNPRGLTSQTRFWVGAGEAGGGLSSDRSNAEWAALRRHLAFGSEQCLTIVSALATFPILLPVPHSPTFYR